jgi:hypothetical protein
MRASALFSSTWVSSESRLVAKDVSSNRICSFRCLLCSSSVLYVCTSSSASAGLEGRLGSKESPGARESWFSSDRMRSDVDVAARCQPSTTLEMQKADIAARSASIGLDVYRRPTWSTARRRRASSRMGR